VKEDYTLFYTTDNTEGKLVDRQKREVIILRVTGVELLKLRDTFPVVRVSSSVKNIPALKYRKK
jgi:hypothetical protein